MSQLNGFLVRPGDDRPDPYYAIFKKKVKFLRDDNVVTYELHVLYKNRKSLNQGIGAHKPSDYGYGGYDEVYIQHIAGIEDPEHRVLRGNNGS